MIYRILVTLISYIMLIGITVSFAAEHFVPVTSYRTGPYGISGAPAANGYVDYLKMINARDGGVGGVILDWEECALKSSGASQISHFNHQVPTMFYIIYTFFFFYY